MVSSKRDGKNGDGDAYHERITGIRKELRGFINYRRFPVVTVIEAWDALYDTDDKTGASAFGSHFKPNNRLFEFSVVV